MSENKRQKVPDVVIFGGMRSGTTSLFRYLSAHPSVHTSEKKELNVFCDSEKMSEKQILEQYQSAFGLIKEGDDQLYVEASPSYTRNYAYVARRMKEILGDVKVIFLIREPFSRIESVYRSMRRSGKVLNSVSFSDFVKAMISRDLSVFDSKRVGVNVFTELELGRYSEIVKDLVSVFGRDSVFVLPTEAMADDPVGAMGLICEFLDLDDSFYHDYTFKVENPSIEPRNRLLYRVALIVNQNLEFVLNRFPRVRVILRELHHKINSAKGESILTEDLESWLKEYYLEDKEVLRDVLDANGFITPDWISI